MPTVMSPMPFHESSHARSMYASGTVSGSCAATSAPGGESAEVTQADATSGHGASNRQRLGDQTVSQDFYCDEALSGRTPVDIVLEPDEVLAFRHTRPFWPVHIVVIPKTHV